MAKKRQEIDLADTVAAQNELLDNVRVFLSVVAVTGRFIEYPDTAIQANKLIGEIMDVKKVRLK